MSEALAKRQDADEIRRVWRTLGPPPNVCAFAQIQVGDRTYVFQHTEGGAMACDGVEVRGPAREGFPTR